jgi:hypothetical protein
MKKNIHKFLGFAVLLFAVLGCSSFIEGFKKGYNEGSNRGTTKTEEPKNTQVITSEDGSCQLSVPNAWSKQTGLNREATLQVANPSEEVYAIIIREPKTDFPKSTTLDDLVDLVRKNARKAITSPQFSDATSTTIGGFDAKQFDVGGTVSGIDVKYLYAVVETPKNFYQIMNWTLADKYNANKSKLQDAIDSFKEVDAEPSSSKKK